MELNTGPIVNSVVNRYILRQIDSFLGSIFRLQLVLGLLTELIKINFNF